MRRGGGERKSKWKREKEEQEKEEEKEQSDVCVWTSIDLNSK